MRLFRPAIASCSLFVLALAVFERQAYAGKLIPMLGALKLRYWIHEGVNLHSREIRKQLGPFSFLHHPEKRQRFIADINQLMETMPFTLFVTAIKKQEHQKRYGSNAANPYELALEFTMERVFHFLSAEQAAELPVVAEARGKKEDQSLERVFLKILTQGTNYISGEDFKKLHCPLVFRSKRDNIAGIQVADLCAYPCARRILRQDKPSPAFEIVWKHIYKGRRFGGWKVFP